MDSLPPGLDSTMPEDSPTLLSMELLEKLELTTAPDPPKPSDVATICYTSGADQTLEMLLRATMCFLMYVSCPRHHWGTEGRRN